MVALTASCSTDICSFIQQALIEGLLYVRFYPCDVGDTVMTDSLGSALLELTVQSGQGWGIGTREGGEKIREGCMEEEMAEPGWI